MLAVERSLEFYKIEFKYTPNKFESASFKIFTFTFYVQSFKLKKIYIYITFQFD